MLLRYSLDMSTLNKIKEQIIEALNHPEAQDGLYFRNFFHLHEEDERIIVEGQQVEILEALKELLSEGKVSMSEEGEEAIFTLAAK